MYTGQTFDFTHDGKEFRATIHRDSDHGSPWDNECGHGPVRTIRDKRDKRPGEYIMWDEYGTAYAYDVQAAQAQALKDGWGFEGADPATMTKRQIAAEAVKRDIKHLEGWVREEWCYIGVGVQALDAAGEREFAQALWGIESNSDDFIRTEVAPELAGMLIQEIAQAESAEFIRYASRAFFASAWADLMEDTERAGMLSGVDILDVMPAETDPAAEHAARTLMFDLCVSNNATGPGDLLSRINAITAHSGGGDRPVTMECLGHYSAMQAMGHGVGLEDAFGSEVRAAVRVPYCEFGSHSLSLDY
mgnify:CR=1 FL=1